MWKGRKQAANQAQNDAIDRAHGHGMSGGALATVISAMALLFSGYSFYEIRPQGHQQFAAFVPPDIATPIPIAPTARLRSSSSPSPSRMMAPARASFCPSI